jgi:hypothetical protein
MKLRKLLLSIAAIVITVSSLSGCIVVPAHGPGYYGHGYYGWGHEYGR